MSDVMQGDRTAGFPTRFQHHERFWYATPSSRWSIWSCKLPFDRAPARWCVLPIRHLGHRGPGWRIDAAPFSGRSIARRQIPLMQGRTSMPRWATGSDGCARPCLTASAGIPIETTLQNELTRARKVLYSFPDLPPFSCLDERQIRRISSFLSTHTCASEERRHRCPRPALLSARVPIRRT